MEKREHILRGPKPQIPLDDGTVGQYLFNSLLRYKELVACMTDPELEQTISYSELITLTGRLANTIKSNGYPMGTVISICSENSVHYLLPVIAGLYVGMIIAPVNPNYTARELIHMYNISKPEIIFCSTNTLQKIVNLKKNCPYVKRIILLHGVSDVEEVETLNNFISSTSESFDVHNFYFEKFDKDDHVALILCSSGTTGFPKGVMLTYKSLMIRLNQSSDTNCNIATHVKPGGAVLNMLPLFHGYGFSMCLGSLTLGHHIIQMHGYKERLLLSSIEKYRIESACFVPVVISRLVKSTFLGNYNLSSLTEIASGASALSTSTIIEVIKRFNIQEVRQGYGLTEATVISTITPLQSAKPSSIGKLLPFIQAKIINVDTRQSLGPNQRGELCLKGETIMKGYMSDPDATRNAIDENGWLHTGDLCYYDEDEYFYLLERLKNIIKYKSFQVAPGELELLLMEYPGIKEATVVGKTDLDAGQLPTAFVVTHKDAKITEQEVQAYIKENVSPEKQLRGGVHFVSVIPRNATGKVLRREMENLLEYNEK